MFPTRASSARQGARSRPLIGSFEENVLNNRLNPIRTVEGYTAEVRASCRNIQPSPLRSGVRVSFFSAGDCFPYLGQVSIGHRGYKIPKKGTLQVTLFNPNGTVVKLFVLMYDLTDMPPNSQTFLRQKTLFLPSTSCPQEVAAGGTNSHQNIDHCGSADQQHDTNMSPVVDNSNSECRKKSQSMIRSRVRYLIHLKYNACNSVVVSHHPVTPSDSIISSKSGRIYLNRDVRIFISKKADLETASQIKKQDYELKAINEMPSHPRYFSR